MCRIWVSTDTRTQRVCSGSNIWRPLAGGATTSLHVLGLQLPIAASVTDAFLWRPVKNDDRLQHSRFQSQESDAVYYNASCSQPQLSIAQNVYWSDAQTNSLKFVFFHCHVSSFSLAPLRELHLHQPTWRSVLCSWVPASEMWTTLTPESQRGRLWCVSMETGYNDRQHVGLLLTMFAVRVGTRTIGHNTHVTCIRSFIARRQKQYDGCNDVGELWSRVVIEFRALLVALRATNVRVWKEAATFGCCRTGNNEMQSENVRARAGGRGRAAKGADVADGL